MSCYGVVLILVFPVTFFVARTLISAFSIFFLGLHDLKFSPWDQFQIELSILLAMAVVSGLVHIGIVGLLFARLPAYPLWLLVGLSVLVAAVSLRILKLAPGDGPSLEVFLAFPGIVMGLVHLLAMLVLRDHLKGPDTLYGD